MINRRLRNKERGATAIEYGLIAALIAAVLVSIITVTGVNLSKVYCYVAGEVGVAGGVENVCNDLNGGIDNPDDPDPTDPPEVSPPLDSPWLPPSWTDSSIGDPGKLRTGLSGGDPTSGSSGAMGWEYGGDDGGFDYNPLGKARIRIVGDLTNGFYIKLLDDCIIGGFGATDSYNYGCSYHEWDGQIYNRNMSNWVGAYCVNNPSYYIPISVDGGYVSTSVCGGHDNIYKLKFTGTMKHGLAYAVVQHSEYKRNPKPTIQVLCQGIWALPGQTTLVSAVGYESAPAAACPDGSVAIGITVNGDTAPLDGKVADIRLADYLAIVQDPPNWHLESGGPVGCVLKNAAGATASLQAGDCDTARAEGLFN